MDFQLDIPTTTINPQFRQQHHHSDSCCQERGPPPTKESGYVITIDWMKLWLCTPNDFGIVTFVLVWYTILQIIVIHETGYMMYYLNMLCICLHYYAFVKGVTTEPGVLPKFKLQTPQELSTIEVPIQETPDEQNENQALKNCQLEMDNATNKDPSTFFQVRECRTCKIQRPAKASHCSQCGNCVKGFDHHCNFMGNCIGERNIKYFFGWLCSMCFQGVVWFYIAFPLLYKQFDLKMYLETIQSNQILSTSLGILLFLLFWACCCTRRRQQVPCLMFVVLSFLPLSLYFYDTSKSYSDNIHSTLLFLMTTLPQAMGALPTTIAYLYNIGSGMTEKEKQVLFRMKESRKVGIIKGLQNILNLVFRTTPKSEIMN